MKIGVRSRVLFIIITTVAYLADEGIDAGVLPKLVDPRMKNGVGSKVHV